MPVNRNHVSFAKSGTVIREARNDSHLFKITASSIKLVADFCFDLCKNNGVSMA